MKIKNEIKEKQIISLSDYLSKLNAFQILNRLKILNDNYSKNLITYEELIQKTRKKEMKNILNRYILNALVTNLESNINYICDIVLEIEKSTLSKEDSKYFEEFKNINKFFFNTYNRINVYECNPSIIEVKENSLKSFFDKLNILYEFESNIKDTTFSKIRNFSTLFYKIEYNFLFNNIKSEDYISFIEKSNIFINIFEKILFNLSEKLKEFDYFNSNDLFEVRVEKEIFDKFVKEKDDLIKEGKYNFSDYYETLCFALGDTVDDLWENPRKLSKPLMNSYLINFIYHEFMNGGLNQFIYNLGQRYEDKENMIEATLEAIRAIESEEHIKLFENLIRLYYKKVKKIHDNLKNCMDFFGTYKKVSFDELDDEFMNLIPLLAKKADEYILKNKDIICI